MLKDYIKTARPSHYIKNFFVFAGIIFSGNFLILDKIFESFVTFFSFCLAASAVYFLNDLFDKEFDKVHPTKKYRPIASGKISVSKVIASYFMLSLSSLTLVILFVDILVFNLILSYLFINLLYSWKLKNVVILDIFLVALGFIIRVYAGCAAIGVLISDWLLLTVLFISILLATAKRRNEFIKKIDPSKKTSRKVISKYSEKLLDQFIAIISAITILTYSLYTILNPEINNLVITIPFVIYGIFRFLYLVYKKDGGAHPERELINDIHIIGCVFIWIILVVGILIIQ